MSYQQGPPPPGQYGAPPNPGYPQQQQQQAAYGAPPPQQQYGQPPQPQQPQYDGQPLQQQQHGGYNQQPPPQQGQYQPAPGQGYPSNQALPSQQQPQGYNQPPAGQYAAPPPTGAGYQPQYQQQPQYGQPPQQGYSQHPPPPQHYGGYNQQQQPNYGYQQPQGAYGQQPGQWNAPPGQQQMGPVIPRTYLGSALHPSENPLLPQHEQLRENQAVDGYDATKDVETIKKACKGFGTDEDKINGVLVPMPAVRLPVLRYAYKSKEGKDLEKLLEKELKGNHERVILNLLRGPLGADLHNIFEACDGVGTHEDMLTELLVGRPPLAIELVKAAFQKRYNKSLEKTVLDELSFKTKSAMQVVLLGDWQDMPNHGRTIEFENGIQPGFGMTPQVNHQMIQDDLLVLSKSIRPLIPDLEQQPVSAILFARSPVHLQALQQAYLQSKRVPLTRHIKQLVDGHLKDMYLLALNSAKKDTTGIWRDAKMLNKAMAGIGTRDEMLTIRLIRAHWDRNRFQQVKHAFKQKTGKDLSTAVMKETSGDYRDALMLLINSI
ncbi:hypothetical protein OIO90_003298 [Microbotryomycetes sp. JL221]|nr:hypothetical protein OIO90_003298 [Microbotryomycetes sp. JL221]